MHLGLKEKVELARVGMGDAQAAAATRRFSALAARSGKGIGSMSLVDPNDEFTQKFLQRVDPRVGMSFTAEQLAAVRRAFQPTPQLVNLRGWLPLTGRRLFFVLMVGRERRSLERRIYERQRYPLWTASNVFVFTAFGAMTFLALVGAVAVFLRPV
ncbi:MAG TPA: hypothetical protein VLG66_07180 [Alphaproteobacteria bacterium]|nr:hypothetical protein [Alphaproteobacteria bacterium]